jgi:alpha-beta hydrolase superfamily lysophospholipase
MLTLKIKKRIFWTLGMGFILMNVVAFFHAYKFTHFADNNIVKTKSPEKLNSFDKLKTLFFGVNNPRPKNSKFPTQKFETIKLKSNKTIEIWQMKGDSAKGTVVLFHGYSGEKSGMLTQSDEFQRLGYNTVLVDFMGSGGSEGNQTTLGFKEAEEVKSVFDYLTTQGEQSIYFFGTSMGSVAIMKAISDNKLKPKAIIIECPFGSMYQTTCARFRIMKAPTFPMAGLLVFWGGVQNNFWALGHNPTEYAKKITCPTLLLYGEQDKNVSRQEIDDIYKNLKTKKVLKTYKLAGHESYWTKYKEDWQTDVRTFLSEN